MLDTDPSHCHNRIIKTNKTALEKYEQKNIPHIIELIVWFVAVLNIRLILSLKYLDILCETWKRNDFMIG